MDLIQIRGVKKTYKKQDCSPNNSESNLAMNIILTNYLDATLLLRETSVTAARASAATIATTT
jgi:hypothetical protein